jgi:hypothetical protein
VILSQIEVAFDVGANGIVHVNSEGSCHRKGVHHAVRAADLTGAAPGVPSRCDRGGRCELDHCEAIQPTGT